MNFQLGDPRKNEPKGRRRPPPDYFSRPVQYKLMVLVGLVMLVLVLMNEARKPENWKWMGFRDKQPSAKKDAGKDGPLAKNRLDAQKTASGDRLLSDQELARSQAWEWVLESLSKSDRELLAAAVGASDLPPFGEHQQEQGKSVLSRTDELWRTYLEHARTSLDENETPSTDKSPPTDDGQLAAKDKQAWREILDHLQKEWNEEAKPFFQKIISGEKVRPPQAAWVDELRFRRSLLEVVDDTFAPRIEKDAWFHYFKILANRDNRALAAASEGRVGHAELARESDYYRGRLVTIRGRAHKGHLQHEPVPRHGISHYYVFWIRPSGGPTSPVLVYSLSKPPGFPEIKDQQELTNLTEDVEFTGYYFKRRAYVDANEKIRFVPMLLAREPVWQGGSPNLGHGSGSPNPLGIGMTVAVAALGAVAIAAYVYFRGRALTAAFSKRSTARDLDRLQDEEVAPGIDESLRRLADEQPDQNAAENPPSSS